MVAHHAPCAMKEGLSHPQKQNRRVLIAVALSAP
jgi:hypothetical protein